MTASTALSASDAVALTDVAQTLTAAVPFLPMQGDEFCSTPAGGLIEAFVGIMIVVFFGAILVATFAAAGIESMPLSGWWNQMGYSMMGKVPISVLFVVVMISVISMTITNGTLGISVPPCIPILG